MDSTDDNTGLDGTGFHQSWFPIGLASELDNSTVTGVDFLGTRVVAYRNAAGKPVVQSAWCPHLGADLSLGRIVDGGLRCPYHHWRFDAAGLCVHIPTGDKILPGAAIFTYPTAEAWGLIWVFNGERPLFDLPRIPDVVEDELAFEARLRGIRNVPPWVSTSNGVDFQHLRTLHNLPTSAPETIDVRQYAIEYRVEPPSTCSTGWSPGRTCSPSICGVKRVMLSCCSPARRSMNVARAASS